MPFIYAIWNVSKISFKMHWKLKLNETSLSFVQCTNSFDIKCENCHIVLAIWNEKWKMINKK